MVWGGVGWVRPAHMGKEVSSTGMVAACLGLRGAQVF
jgi:hypothetical protein